MLERVLRNIQATAELLGQPLSDAALAVMAKDLAGYTETQIDTALARLRENHTGRLTIGAMRNVMPAKAPTTPPRFQLGHTPAPPVREDPPDMDDEAVAEARARVRAGRNKQIWAALRDITAERMSGGMQRTVPAPDREGKPDSRPLPPVAKPAQAAFRKNLPRNPFLDDLKETDDGKENPGAAA